LSANQRELLTGSHKAPNLYGVLQPKISSGPALKAICHDTALLFLSLQQSGRLPLYFKNKFGDHCNAAIAALVLDEVLEIEHKGEFVSGAGACEALNTDTPDPGGMDAIAKLSRQALKYAQALHLNDAAAISSRLYFYNGLPLSPKRRSEFSRPESVSDYLGIGGRNGSLLRRNWSMHPVERDKDNWFMWSSLRQHQPTHSGKGTYKLYVSPHLDGMAEVFQATVETLSMTPTLSFKVGCGVRGLLRPDKLIAYFPNFEALSETADRLRQKLAGSPAHCVPFTAAITADGLLSWGVDPPIAPQTCLIPFQESWRLWVTNRLAAALLVAKAARQETMEPWQFAVARLRLEGIDTTTWAPTNTWRAD
jgi:hypothetical protein